ncbi:hypothetical protein [Ehrlichia ruminantium]|uniref:Uncharacterized protein n=1 Tax=Ehrlichia ruminantium (strain Welgevonden) TaxID=254945 RepID=A0A0H3LZI7_EHRRW|nr:hypothetical protein [Ehrlichia ruminantium]QLK54953.1 hypothetical protein FDZ62_01565 [Ehrlichia ruminantium]QLK55871.1 hypothetical protein FDZ61_01560 [Ehrlichia ruminantium]QLK57696.1 hypothetical protein FDZ59_01515 [Ehrlichia ruminantium]UOD98156.1 hypothetical protein IMW64_01525 [Ehrlichia ruminantium]UOD99973.1 hypothetical protein IMW62_01570 [Ehrlichia ruminantium]
MKKQTSSILFYISLIAFIAALSSYSKLKQQFYGPTFFYSFSITFSIIAGFLLFSIAKYIYYTTYGLSLKYKDRDHALNINTENQYGILISIPPEELCDTDYTHNISKISINNQKTNPIVHIKYNQGLFFKPTKLQHNIKEILLLTNNNIINSIKSRQDISGLLITTNSNPLLKEISQENTITNYTLNLQSDRTLSLEISYIMNDFQKYTHQELHNILKSQASNHRNYTLKNQETIYDLTALSLLEDIKESGPEHHWYTTRQGQIAISFFKKFPIKDILDSNRLSIDLPKELQDKLTFIHNYIQQDKKIIPQDNNYDKAICARIAHTYYNYSYEMNIYPCLSLDIGQDNNHLRKILQEEIKKNEVFKQICVLSTFDLEHNTRSNSNTRSNAMTRLVIRHLSNRNDLFTILTQKINDIQDNYGFIDCTQDHGDITSLLRELSHGDKKCTVPELKKRARNYVTSFLKKHIPSNLERTTTIKLKVANVTQLSTKSQKEKISPTTSINSSVLEGNTTQPQVHTR